MTKQTLKYLQGVNRSGTLGLNCNPVVFHKNAVRLVHVFLM